MSAINVESASNAIIEYLKNEYELELSVEEITEIINNHKQPVEDEPEPEVKPKKAKNTKPKTKAMEPQKHENGKWVAKHGRSQFVLKSKTQKIIVGKISKNKVVELTDNDKSTLDKLEWSYQGAEVEAEEVESEVEVEDEEVESKESESEQEPESEQEEPEAEVKPAKKPSKKSSKPSEKKSSKKPSKKPSKKSSKASTKDENKIKRPLNAYIIYSQEVRNKVKSENPDSKVGDISKIIGAMWKELSPSKKKKFEKLASEAKAKYESEVAKQSDNEEAQEVEAESDEE
jgi:hypothetical protein